jgi:hypothetical protein
MIIRTIRLTLETLEGRLAPAASVVTASLNPTTGLLTITGDDQANGLTIKITAVDTVLTPDPNTSVNGQGADTPVTLTGTAKALKVNLNGGNDILSIDTGSDFILPGGAAIDLGGGINTLDISTSQKIELGSLKVTGGDGTDDVRLAGGAGLGKVFGPAAISLGPGSGGVTLAEISFLGPGGLSIAAAPSSPLTIVQATDVTVVKALTVAGGNSDTLTITGSTLGGLKAAGAVTSATLSGSTINGKVAISGGFKGSLAVSNSTVSGDLSVAGTVEAYLQESSGTFAAGNVTVTSGLTGSVKFSGTSATIGGSLNVRGGFAADVRLATTAVSEVTGAIDVKGGSYSNYFVTNSYFKADGDVTLTLGNGSSNASIGHGNAPVALLGNLTIQTGAGNDGVGLLNVDVSKATSIKLGAGSDTLGINAGSTFAGPFTADTGAGDDSIVIAQFLGMPAPVTFAAKTTITTGAGNDMLLLGRGTNGDANSKAVFAPGLGSTIDGGTGYNTFDDGAPMSYSGLTFGTSIVNFTDPNP